MEYKGQTIQAPLRCPKSLKEVNNLDLPEVVSGFPSPYPIGINVRVGLSPFDYMRYMSS